MNAINKPLFFGLYVIAKIFSLFFLIGPLAWSMGDFQQGDLPFLSLSYFFDILAFIVLVVLVYKMWVALPAKNARTTPEKAVGYLFIPVYNFYWWFIALWGWSQDWNGYASKSNGKISRVPEFLPLSIAILFFLSGTIGLFLSLVGQQWASAIITIPNCILVPILIFKVCDALNGSVRTQKENNYGLASIILGVMSIILPVLGLVCGPIAIALSEKQRKIMREAMAKTGLITGIIGIVFSLFSTMFIVTYLFFA
jgi:hypothetical protein